MNDDVGRLYVSLGRINRALRRDAPDAPVGHGALSALATLTQDGSLRLGTLAAAEGISAPSMTRIVASLESQGYARRTADPDDHRAYLVEATGSGRDVVLAGRATRMQALRTRLARLPTEQQDRVRDALVALEQLSVTR